LKKSNVRSTTEKTEVVQFRNIVKDRTRLDAIINYYIKKGKMINFPSHHDLEVLQSNHEPRRKATSTRHLVNQNCLPFIPHDDEIVGREFAIAICIQELFNISLNFAIIDIYISCLLQTLSR